MTCVYFIKPKGMSGPIKIGCSEVPETRLEALSVWSPFPLELIGAVKGALKDERYVHECLALHHSHREWFNAAPEVLAVIERILSAGSVDAIRGDLKPVKSIRIFASRKWTEDRKRWWSYASRIRNAERRLREKQRNWHSPDEVHDCIREWRDGGNTPTQDQIARLDAYLADPIAQGVIPRWERSRRKTKAAA